MIRQTDQDKLASFVRGVLPEATRHVEESGREIVQTVVWLVGLATGLLALFAAKPEMAAATGNTGRALIATLLAVVLLGVAQRLVRQVAMDKERQISHMAHMHLWGMTEAFDDPLPLQDWWDEAEILGALKEDFDLDYSFLQEKNAPLETYRDAFAHQYAIWESGELKKKEDMQNFSAALQGRASPIPENPEEKPLDSLRAYASSVRWWRQAANVLYWATGTSFACAAALTAATLIR